jgi:hypothetical protein
MTENICFKRNHFIVLITIFMICGFFYTVKSNKYNFESDKLHENIRELNNKIKKNDKKYKNELKKILDDHNKRNRTNLNTDMILKNNNIKENYDNLKRKLNDNKELVRKVNEKIKMERIKLEKIKNKYITLRDRNVLNDPIIPPEKRLPRHIYRNNINNHFNIPSRGYPDNYQIFGLLTRNSDEKALQLFGRQKYPGSKTYEYFVTGKDPSGLQIKIPLNMDNNKQIYDSDSINIPELNSSKGSFKVSLYENNAPVYNPNLI